MSATRPEVPDFAALPDDADPFAVVFVVNDSRDDSGNIAAERDILQASSTALIQLLTSEDEAVVALVREWTAGRIRKIVKRARASAWDKAAVLEHPHTVAEHNGAKVLAFAPMRLSEQPKELKKLQVTGLNSSDTAPADYGKRDHLEVSVNDSLNMSTGKVVAQVGHAVQLFMLYADPEQVKEWAVTGHLVKVVRAENISDDASAAIIVHDAGFTEVPSGSLTATADFKNMEGK